MPGISSFLFSIETEQNIEDIKQASLSLMKNTNPETFSVDCRRHNKGFKTNSNEINQIVGQLICDEYKFKVKLKNPEIALNIEICNTKAYIGTEKTQGVGGLPVGSAEKMISLLSGGIDSPVASYMMMKRGVKVTFIHFQNKTQMTRSASKKVEKLVKQLSSIQGQSKLYIIPFEEIQKELIMKVPAKYRMIIYRRFMGRIAEAIARSERINVMITGDSLAQVASQTVPNLLAINDAVNLMVVSPLIGLNKNEIIKVSKQIDTYDISIEPYTDCCSFFIAKNPETKARMSEVEKIEANLDIDSLIKIGFESKILKKF